MLKFYHQFQLHIRIIINYYNIIELTIVSNSHLFWFSITLLTNWVKRSLNLLNHSIGSKTKTNHDSFTHVFPRLGSVCMHLLRAFFFFWGGGGGGRGLNYQTHNYLHCSHSTYNTTLNIYSTYNTIQYLHYLSCETYIARIRLRYNTYLLLTEFEGRTVSCGPSFFPCDLCPKREARGP